MTEYDSTFGYGPITETSGGSPITYPGGDTNSNDAQIRGMDFDEQGNLTSAVVLFRTYNNAFGEFILRGHAVLTKSVPGNLHVRVQAAQSTATVGDTEYSYFGAGKAWVKLTRADF